MANSTFNKSFNVVTVEKSVVIDNNGGKLFDNEVCVVSIMEKNGYVTGFAYCRGGKTYMKCTMISTAAWETVSNGTLTFLITYIEE